MTGYILAYLMLLHASVGQITKLSITNPKGYKTDAAFSMNLLRPGIDLPSVGKNPLVLNELVIDSPLLNTEMNEKGASNLKEISDNLSANTAAADNEASSAHEQAGSEPLRILIRKLIIKGVIYAVHSPVEKLHNAKGTLPIIILLNNPADSRYKSTDCSFLLKRPAVILIFRNRGYRGCVMLDIRHKETGTVLVSIDAQTLMQADLRDMLLEDADLSGADLSGAMLNDANLVNADLSGANLTGANLAGAHLNGADLGGANLTGAKLGAESKSAAAMLADCNLENCDFSRADLRKVELRNSNLKDTILSRADLRSADLSGADMRNCIAHNALFIKANLRETNLSGADFSDSHLNDANMIKANLSGARLGSRHPEGFTVINLANLEGADLSGAHMQNISAEDAILKHANLSNADLSRAVMGGAILRSANVAGANFQGVELATVAMEFANFSQALNATIPSYKTNLR